MQTLKKQIPYFSITLLAVVLSLVVAFNYDYWKNEIKSQVPFGQFSQIPQLENPAEEEEPVEENIASIAASWVKDLLFTTTSK